MKVISIEPYKAKDQTDRWKVIFEGDPNPLIMGTPPAFGLGTDLPKDQLKLTSKNHYYFYTLIQQEKTPYSRTPEQNASIELQTVWKGLVEIFVAGKLEEFETSDSLFVKGMRRYAERRLVQDHPFIEENINKAEKSTPEVFKG
jgi:hypothetical protein